MQVHSLFLVLAMLLSIISGVIDVRKVGGVNSIGEGLGNFHRGKEQRS